MTAANRLAESVTARLTMPLSRGGTVRLVPPIGAVQSLAVAAAEPVLSGATWHELRSAKLRNLRELAAIDRVSEPSRGEWLLAFALNDLLQAINPELVKLAGSQRPLLLIHMASQVIACAGAPRNLGEALSRHATFARLPELTRRDTELSWWVGRRTFRGVPPPPRFLSWPKLRRVHAQGRVVPLYAMPPGSRPWTTRWNETLQSLIAASPVTDLISMTREKPTFSFSGASLAILCSKAARVIVCRALERSGQLPGAISVVRRAAAEIDEPSGAAACVALSFAEELVARHRGAPPVGSPE